MRAAEKAVADQRLSKFQGRADHVRRQVRDRKSLELVKYCFKHRRGANQYVGMDFELNCTHSSVIDNLEISMIWCQVGMAFMGVLIALGVLGGTCHNLNEVQFPQETNPGAYTQ